MGGVGCPELGLVLNQCLPRADADEVKPHQHPPSNAVLEEETEAAMLAQARHTLLQGHARMLRLNLPASAVVAILVGAVLWFYSDRTVVLLAVFSVVAIVTAAYLHVRRLPEDASSDAVENRLIVVQLAGGVAWGTLFFAMPETRDAQVFMAMLIPGAMAVNAVEATANAKTFLAFHLPFSVLAAAAVWLRADQMPTIALLAIAITAVYMVVLARARGMEAEEHALLTVHNESLAGRLRTVNEDLQHRSTHDTLTGLPNRFAIERGLNKMMAHAEEQPVAALFIDLDGFKDINDTMGHDTGDDLLVIVARRFAAVVPDEALLGRLGGDEMVVLFPNFGSLRQVEDLAHRMLESLAPAILISGSRQHIGASIGISMTSMSCRTGRDLLRFADIALYEAKALGGRQWVSFASEMLDGPTPNLRSASTAVAARCELHPIEGDARTV